MMNDDEIMLDTGSGMDCDRINPQQQNGHVDERDLDTR
jgi:hypothetical protein